MEDHTLRAAEIDIQGLEKFHDMSRQMTDLIIGLLNKNSLTIDELKGKKEFKKMKNMEMWLSGQHDFFLDEIVAIECYFGVKILHIE